MTSTSHPYEHQSPIPADEQDPVPVVPTGELAQGAQPSYEQSGDTLTRRELFIAGLGGAAATAVVLGAGAWAARDYYVHDNSTGLDRLVARSRAQSEIDANHEAETTLLFSNEKAQEIADQLGVTMAAMINPGHGIEENPEQGRKFDAVASSTQALPISYPMTYDYLNVANMIAAPKEKGGWEIPVNFTLALASLESGGNANAGSPEGAVGWLQLIPELHLVGENVEDPVDEADWFKPEETWSQAGKYMDQCLSAARATMDPDAESLRFRHPNLLACAAGMYNAGIEGGSGEYDGLAVETQQYIQHYLRYTLVAEIASRLREEGLNDEDIVEALQPSLGMKARAYAFSKYELSSEYTPDQALAYLASDLTEDPSSEVERDLYAAYNAYLEGEAQPDFNDEMTNPFILMHASTNAGFMTGSVYERNNSTEDLLRIKTEG